LQLLGFVTAPVCIAGIVLSSSRATLGVVVVAVLLVLAGAVRAGRAVALRAGAVVALGVVLTFALPGPPLFAHWHSPLSAATDRSAAGETVANNGKYRTEFWREAISVTADHPVTGAGYHGLGTASELTSPAEWARSPLAHNGYLQAFADGGLLLGVPFTAACVALGLGLLGVVRRTRLRLDRDTAVPLAASIAALGLLAHSFVDFDWSHPALFAMVAMTGAVALSGGGARAPKSRSRHVAMTCVALVAMVSLAGAFAVRTWARTDRVAHNGAASGSRSADDLVRRSSGLFSDYRPAAAVLRQADAGRPVPAATLRTAYRRTADAATVDPLLAAYRARALVLLGAPAAALRASTDLLHALGRDGYPFVAGDVAVTLAMAGDRVGARQLLGPVLVADLTGQPSQRVWADVAAATRAGLLDDPATARCASAAATHLVGPAPAGLDVALADGAPGLADCSARLEAFAQ
jgi:hypothetical protein